ncbi:MAG: chemotaxis-specific protein-glutamate methyltransferase CheB [Actinobacteria bacterium]|nr:chemotaxis-specific protein-glutamate methyltransferase CheB [Actinomycetota bacterium]
MSSMSTAGPTGAPPPAAAELRFPQRRVDLRDAVRVMLVDDSLVVRRLLHDALTHSGGIDVVAVAGSGEQALEILSESRPDVVLLDLEMPGMGGLAALRTMKQRWPRLPVIVVSAITQRGSEVAQTAWRLGANDVWAKPSRSASRADAQQEIARWLAPRVRAWGSCRSRVVPRPPDLPVRTAPPGPRLPAAARPSAGMPQAILIGVSTGGPDALNAILPALPPNLPVPVVVVQHMPPMFTASLARRFDAVCAVPVVESSHGMPCLPGRVHIAAGGSHTRVELRHGRPVLVHDFGEPVQSCRPSVDVLLRSAAEVWGGQTVTAILTGMGRDGTDGATVLHGQGGLVIAQDEATSVVWGMPGSVVRAEVCDLVLPLQGIAQALVAAATRPRQQPGAPAAVSGGAAAEGSLSLTV